MLRGLFMMVAMVVLTGALGVPAIAGAVLFPGRHVTMRLGKLWSRLLLRVAGVRVTYAGLERTATDRPVIFISNHLSNVDIWALIPALPDAAVFVAKQSLFRIPVMGRAMRLAGFIPIDRSRLPQAIQSLDRAAAKIREQGRPVVLFAEGTRSRDGRLGPFKKGAFHVALATRVPVVPVSISGSGSVIRPRGLRVTPGTVRVTLGEPIDLRQFGPDDLSGLMAVVRAAIARHLDPEELHPADLALQAESR